MARRSRRSRTERTEPEPKPVTVTLAPPAHTVRRQAGLGLPTGQEFVESVAGYALGAGMTVITTAVLPPDNKFVGGTLGILIGGLLVATSPIGTLAQEIGAGSFIGGLTWFVDDLLGPAEHPTTGAAVREVT